MTTKRKWAKQNPLYKVHENIKSRCNNKNDRNYPNYGGRGITYDRKWQTYKGFLEDMGSTWKPGLSIDRIDNNGNYCKENCRWATRKEQNNNRRTNRHIEFNKETKTLIEWVRYLGLNESRTVMRLQRGWSVEDAFTLSKNTKYTRYKHIQSLSLTNHL